MCAHGGMEIGGDPVTSDRRSSALPRFDRTPARSGSSSPQAPRATSKALIAADRSASAPDCS
jgi:hypothetical protein